MTTADYSLERGLPVSMEAERGILAGILLDETLFDEVAASIGEEHFSLDAHRRIFHRMASLRRAGQPLDLITITECLHRNKELESVGDASYLSSLIDGAIERPSLTHYARLLKGKALLRGLINVAQNAISEAIDHTDEPEEVLARAERAVLQLSENSVGEKPLVSLAEATPDAYNAMFRQESLGLTTSIPKLDEKTRGICPEDFWIIGGDPGSGKSALAAQIAAENGRRGRKIGLWSIEMRKNRVVRRLWCYESGLFYSKLRDNPKYLTPADRGDLEAAVKQVAEWPVYINDASSLTPQAFAAQARHAVLRDKLELVIVDHIQIMTEAMPGKDDIAKIKEISGILRQFAKDYCPVIALSQLTRQSKEQRGKPPVMSDLYGGRWLDMNASVILMSWVPEGENEKHDELILAKNREGETGYPVPILFRKPLMRFEPRELVK
jgi:replicative DNA helicase